VDIEGFSSWSQVLRAGSRGGQRYPGIQEALQAIGGKGKGKEGGRRSTGTQETGFRSQGELERTKWDSCTDEFEQ
jgi:hypothetical protein